MKANVDLNQCRKIAAIYDDSGLFVEHSVVVSAIDQTRKQFLSCLTAYADLYRYGTDVDKDFVADAWELIQISYSDAIRDNGGSKAKAAQQFRNARTYAAEKLKAEFIDRNLILDIAHGSFDVTPMTSDEVAALRKMQVNGAAKVRAAKSIKAGLNSRMVDKQAGAQTGTHKAQAPSPAAKSLSYLDQAASLIQLMNLDDLETHLIAVKAAIAASKKETAQAAAAAAAAAKAAAAKAAKAATSNAGRVAAAAAKAAKAKAAADKAAKAAAVKTDRANGTVTSAANAEKSAAIIAQQRKDKASATKARRKAGNAGTSAVNATL